MSVRMGAPLWRLGAWLGMPVTVRVDILRDEEAGVYVATSPDLRGLVVEAETLDELFAEVRSAAVELMEPTGRRDTLGKTILQYNTELCAA